MGRGGRGWSTGRKGSTVVSLTSARVGLIKKERGSKEEENKEEKRKE